MFDDPLGNNISDNVGLPPIVQGLACLIKGLCHCRGCLVIQCSDHVHFLLLSQKGLSRMLLAAHRSLLFFRVELLNTGLMTQSRQFLCPFFRIKPSMRFGPPPSNHSEPDVRIH